MLRTKLTIAPEDIAQALRKGKEPEPAPKPIPTPIVVQPPKPAVQIKVSLSDVVSAASWAWSCWSSYNDTKHQHDHQIMKLAEERFGKLTVAEIVANTKISRKKIHQSLERLIEADLCRAVPILVKDERGTYEEVIYIFDRFLPQFRDCNYCGVEQVLGIINRCTCCGAPLPPKVERHYR